MPLSSYPLAPRLIGHVFVEADGALSVTPTIACTPADAAMLRTAGCRYVSSDDRLWQAAQRRAEDA